MASTAEVASGAVTREHRPVRSARTVIGGLLALVVPIGVWFAPLRLEATPKHALAVASFMILAWISEVMPHAVTGLIGCYLFWVLGVVKFDLAFGGMVDQTPWFLFGAGLIGMMATKSGLARRLAYLVMRRAGTSYSRILLGLILTSFLLTLLVPSGLACVVIMATVALGLMEALGAPRGSNIGKGIFVTLTYTAGCFDKMVIAGASTILGRGLIERATGIHIYWSLWFFAFLPCVLITIVFIWRLVLWLYPPEKVAHEGVGLYLEDALVKMGPWTSAEKRAMILMLLAIGLWMTDLLHHISPAVIGIGAGLLALTPGLGLLDQEDLKRYNFLPMLFVAAAISMGDVLVQTRALDALTGIMFSWMRPLTTNAPSLVLVPYWTAFLYHIFLGNELSMLATSIPPLMNFAKTSGLHPLPLGMVWSFAAGGKIFVYQSGVLVAGYAYGYFDSWDVFRVGLWVTLAESLVLLLLVPLYWPLLGIH
jgi:solute carrier family 13 (sodium-dependent dicarboxylate transporter), member 2/3/5